MIKASALPLALLALISVAPAVHAFETYRVTGLKAGDTLTLRAEPSDGEKLSDWKEIARIPAGSADVLGTGRSKTVGDQRWHEVVFKDARGWVNGKFLEGGEPADLKDQTFQCAGTEPFWGVTLGTGGGDYTAPDVTVALTTERVQPSTARLFPLLYRLKDAKGQTYRASVSHQTWCSDGMSDYDFAFQVLLSNDDAFQEGCCVLRR